jgi:hypothetical protein
MTSLNIKILIFMLLFRSGCELASWAEDYVFSELIPAFQASCTPIIEWSIGIKEKKRKYKKIGAQDANGILCANTRFLSIPVRSNCIDKFHSQLYHLPLAHRMKILHQTISTQNARNAQDRRTGMSVLYSIHSAPLRIPQLLSWAEQTHSKWTFF